MWQNNTNDYKTRIRQELSAQANAQFLYFLLQESIRLLEIRQQEYKANLSWFNSDYRHKKTFIKRSQRAIHSFKQLSPETGKFQLSKLFARLSFVHELLRENCADASVLSFVSACEEARRYNDFSGMVHYAIKSPIVKLCFELTTEYYQKRARKLYQRADELALVPRIQATLGLDRLPQAVKQSIFYKIGQKAKVEEMWMDAVYPKRLAVRTSILQARLTAHSDDLSTCVSVSYERCRDLRKQAGLFATDAQKKLSALCRIHENSLLTDIEKAAKRIKRFTITKKTGRRSVMTLVQKLQALRQFDHNVFLKIKNQEDLKEVLKKISSIQHSIEKRLRHLKELPLMRVDLSVLSSLEQSFNDLIDAIQQQAHSYATEAQFIESSQSLPKVNVDHEMQQSDEAVAWRKLRLTLFEIAEHYQIPSASHTVAGIEHLLDAIEKLSVNRDADLASGCLLDPEKLMSVSDLSMLTYFILARRYADNLHTDNTVAHPFMPVEFDKKRGLMLHSAVQNSRFDTVLDVLQELKSTPLLHYSVRLVVLAMLQESRASQEYATLYSLLMAILTNSYDEFVIHHHALPNNKHWVMDYLPYAIESRPNHQVMSFVRTRLLGNGYVTSSTIFPLPKYVIEDTASRRISVDIDMIAGSPEVHRGSLSQSSLRNSLVLVSSSPERRKASVDRLEDVCSQLVVHAKSIMSKHQDFGVMANYDANNPVGHNNIRIMHQRAQQNGHDNYLVIIYMLITWYYSRRENKLYTDECSAYQPMLETCFLLGESLVAQLSRPQSVDYKIFERLLNLETKSLASSARKLHTTLLKLIPYAHLGLALSEDDFALIDTALKFVNQFSGVFGVNREGMIKDAMVEALIEYRGANKSLLLMLTLWQAVLRTVTVEDNQRSQQYKTFYTQVDHWQRRARLAIEGGEKDWPDDLKNYIPTINQLNEVSQNVKNIWLAIQKFTPIQAIRVMSTDKQSEFTALSQKHTDELSQDDAQAEFMRYLSFVFASNLHLAQGYIDQLGIIWGGYGQAANSLKIAIMLLECYELYYRSNQDVGVDKVYSLKQRIGIQQFVLNEEDLPESINGRPMAAGYSRLRMVLFGIAKTNTQSLRAPNRQNEIK